MTLSLARESLKHSAVEFAFFRKTTRRHWELLLSGETKYLLKSARTVSPIFWWTKSWKLLFASAAPPLNRCVWNTERKTKAATGWAVGGREMLAQKSKCFFLFRLLVVNVFAGRVETEQKGYRTPSRFQSIPRPRTTIHILFEKRKRIKQIIVDSG